MCESKFNGLLWRTMAQKPLIDWVSSRLWTVALDARPWISYVIVLFVLYIPYASPIRDTEDLFNNCLMNPLNTLLDLLFYTRGLLPALIHYSTVLCIELDVFIKLYLKTWRITLVFMTYLHSPYQTFTKIRNNNICFEDKYLLFLCLFIFPHTKLGSTPEASDIIGFPASLHSRSLSFIHTQIWMNDNI